MTWPLNNRKSPANDRLDSYIKERDELLSSHLHLLSKMRERLHHDADERFFQQLDAEKELCSRLTELTKVIRASSSEQSDEDRFNERLRHLSELQCECRTLLRQRIQDTGRRLDSVRALPIRPSAFSKVESPSRLDIQG